MKRILLTTPDYPPQVGGLTTFTLNLEKVLIKLGLKYDLFVWRSTMDLIKKKDQITDKTIVINVHFLAGLFLGNTKKAKYLNFIHGSEILFYSPHLMKRIVKRLLKRKCLNYLEDSFLNVFISEFTLKKMETLGLKINYSRDMILHNAIDLSSSELCEKTHLEDKLKFVMMARDVPHKNLAGAVRFCENLSQISGRKIDLYLSSDRYTSSQINIINCSKISNIDRDEIYKQCDFNLLLSLDHSSRGFFEGFGLTALEAAKFGTPSIVSSSGGLPENIHDGVNGFVLKDNGPSEIRELWDKLGKIEVDKLRVDTFNHNQNSHGLDIYEKLLEKVIYG